MRFSSSVRVSAEEEEEENSRTHRIINYTSSHRTFLSQKMSINKTKKTREKFVSKTNRQILLEINYRSLTVARKIIYLNLSGRLSINANAMMISVAAPIARSLIRIDKDMAIFLSSFFELQIAI